MNRKGVTILELLISISMISIVVLLLVKVMLSLSTINNDSSYASSDEIKRTEIIKTIESDFLKLKLKGVSINESENSEITFSYEEAEKKLIIYKDKIIYDNNVYSLKSENAIYDLCPKISYQEIDDNYYVVSIILNVLIDNKNTTKNDDINLTYLGFKKDINSYQTNNTCS